MMKLFDWVVTNIRVYLFSILLISALSFFNIQGEIYHEHLEIRGANYNDNYYEITSISLFNSESFEESSGGFWPFVKFIRNGVRGTAGSSYWDVLHEFHGFFFMWDYAEIFFYGILLPLFCWVVKKK